MIKVLIADDHFLVREGIKMVLSDIRDVSISGEAANGPEVLHALKNSPTNLVLLDMTMPGVCGIELIKRIKSEYPRITILVLSMHGEPQLAAQALKAGASGYITKGLSSDVLEIAIRKVGNGQNYITPDLAEKIVFDFKVPVDSVQEKLTDRERQIFDLLQIGKTVTQIAKDLAVSPKTVSTHKMRVMAKLNCNNNAELLRYSQERAYAGL